jgi:hypothetical protein
MKYVEWECFKTRKTHLSFLHIPFHLLVITDPHFYQLEICHVNYTIPLLPWNMFELHLYFLKECILPLLLLFNLLILTLKKQVYKRLVSIGYLTQKKKGSKIHSHNMWLITELNWGYKIILKFNIWLKM